MYEQPQSPYQQPMQPAPQQDPALVQRANKKRRMWALICLTGPTLGIILLIVINLVVGSMLTSNTPATDPNDPNQLFGSDSPAGNAITPLLFIFGAVFGLAWLPGIIIGIILLTGRKK